MLLLVFLKNKESVKLLFRVGVYIVILYKRRKKGDELSKFVHYNHVS